MRKERLSEAVITYIVLIFVSFIFFFPVLWLVMASFSASGSIYDYDGFFPKSFSFGTYVKLYTDVWLSELAQEYTLYFGVFMRSFNSACDTDCLHHEQVQVQNEKTTYEDNAGAEHVP